MSDEIGVNIILTIGDRKIEVTESEARALHKRLCAVFGDNVNTFPVVQPATSPLGFPPYVPYCGPGSKPVTDYRDFSGKYDVETVGLGQSRGESAGVSICGGPDDPQSTHTWS